MKYIFKNKCKASIKKRASSVVGIIAYGTNTNTLTIFPAVVHAITNAKTRIIVVLPRNYVKKVPIAPACRS